ncbi:hypothetical protein ACS0TY_033999 [Phlomoides rotata]
MEMQAEAERKRRAQVLESEGERQANINITDGKKSSVILASEAAKMDQVNRAQVLLDPFFFFLLYVKEVASIEQVENEAAHRVEAPVVVISKGIALALGKFSCKIEAYGGQALTFGGDVSS